MNVLIAIYMILVGVIMIGFWGLLIARKQAELDERPWDMRLHIAAEAVTAVLLILSGAGGLVASLQTAGWAPVGLGMLLYTTLNSPGFYAGKKNWPMVGMFATLAVLTITALVALLALGA